MPTRITFMLLLISLTSCSNVGRTSSRDIDIAVDAKFDESWSPRTTSDRRQLLEMCSRGEIDCGKEFYLVQLCSIENGLSSLTIITAGDSHHFQSLIDGLLVPTTAPTFPPDIIEDIRAGEIDRIKKYYSSISDPLWYDQSLTLLLRLGNGYELVDYSWAF